MNLNTINSKVMAAGAAIFLLAVSTAGSGLWAAVHLSNALSRAMQSASVLRAHMDADMMHDALRADMLMVLRSADPASGVRISEVQADIAEHAKRFRAGNADALKGALDPETRSALQAVKAPLEAYISGAEQMAAIAARDPGAAEARMPQFLKLFSQLEGDMERASQRIEASANAEANAARSAAGFAQALMAALVLVAAAVSVLLVVLARRVLVRPIADVTSALDGLASGDLSVDPPHTGRADEIGRMSRALFTFKQAVADRQAELEAADNRAAMELERQENERRRAEEERAREAVVSALGQGLERLSQGDLTARLNTAFPAQYEALRSNFNAAVVQLGETMALVVGSAKTMQSGSGEISQAADDLSRRTEHQAASLEETAAALDEVTATVQRSAEGAGRAQQVAEVARGEVERSGEVVSQATGAMSAIEESSGKIANIVGLIEEIAFQINLLALNAGVEAARAGEAGKGFAVVATEVRALAQRTADAAKEIKGLILDSTRQVGDGVELVTRTGEALERIRATVAEMYGLVSDISVSAREQSTALVEVNTAINQMDQVTQQNAAMVEETTAASHNLAREAQGLARLIQRFRLVAEETRAAA